MPMSGRALHVARRMPGRTSIHLRACYGVSYEIAIIHAALGQTDAACAALHRAFDDHSPTLNWLRLDPPNRRVSHELLCSGAHLRPLRTSRTSRASSRSCSASVLVFFVGPAARGLLATIGFCTTAGRGAAGAATGDACLIAARGTACGANRACSASLTRTIDGDEKILCVESTSRGFATIARRVRAQSTRKSVRRLNKSRMRRMHKKPEPFARPLRVKRCRSSIPAGITCRRRPRLGNHDRRSAGARNPGR